MNIGHLENGVKSQQPSHKGVIEETTGQSWADHDTTVMLVTRTVVADYFELRFTELTIVYILFRPRT